MTPLVSFFRAFYLKYFIEYKIHHSVTVSHHALIITFMRWSWWSSCMKFLCSWITFFIHTSLMNPCSCTWTYLTNMPAGYINHFKIQHIVWHIQGITKSHEQWWAFDVKSGLIFHVMPLGMLSVTCLLIDANYLTRDQFPSALRNIWQLASNVLGRVVIGRGGRTVSSLQQELKTFVLENHES